MPEKGSDAIFVMLKFLFVWKSLSAQTGCGIIQNLGSSWCQASLFCTVSKITLTRLIRSNHLRDLHGLVLAGRYFGYRTSALLFCTIN